MFVATQNLMKEGLKDKQVIEQAIPILHKLSLEYKISLVASTLPRSFKLFSKYQIDSWWRGIMQLGRSLVTT